MIALIFVGVNKLNCNSRLVNSSLIWLISVDLPQPAGPEIKHDLKSSNTSFTNGVKYYHQHLSQF